jgi:hypothetical protein
MSAPVFRSVCEMVRPFTSARPSRFMSDTGPSPATYGPCCSLFSPSAGSRERLPPASLTHSSRRSPRTFTRRWPMSPCFRQGGLRPPFPFAATPGALPGVHVSARDRSTAAFSRKAARRGSRGSKRPRFMEWALGVQPPKRLPNHSSTVGLRARGISVRGLHPPTRRQKLQLFGDDGESCGRSPWRKRPDFWLAPTRPRDTAAAINPTGRKWEQGCKGSPAGGA